MTKEEIIKRQEDEIESLKQTVENLRQDNINLKAEIDELENYDYYKAVDNDIEFALKNDYDLAGYMKSHRDEDYEDISQEFYDRLFDADSVTGNASGSYFCSTYKACRSLCSNYSLLTEATEFFEGYRVDALNPESMDVTIRCYVFQEIFDKVFYRVYNEIKETENQD